MTFRMIRFCVVLLLEMPLGVMPIRVMAFGMMSFSVTPFTVMPLSSGFLCALKQVNKEG